MANKPKHVCFTCKTSRQDCRKYRFVGPRKPTAAIIHVCKGCAAGREDIKFANACAEQKVG